GAYEALGRLYRGIIVNSMKQYVMLGDPAVQTKNIQGDDDDRWVFTEDNPRRELTTAAQLAAAARVLYSFNENLCRKALKAAQELFEVTEVRESKNAYDFAGSSAKDALLAKIHAATELFITTREQKYSDFLLSETETIVNNMEKVAWFVCRAEKYIGDEYFTRAIHAALPELKRELDILKAETPYGIPYRPHVWGAGWMIQRQGYEYFFLHKAYPHIFTPEMVFDALNFVLGCHPGSNNMSFASGIGTKSALVAYGWNRADWSFCPGGVISGTALIRPDFPELLEFPYLWQQTEYVLGGGSSHYMFLVLAAQWILGEG
ncbi:MAG: glycoside hydrolase family 9 protein, partial [Oscillospiraceae bacterium]|nr:glycoside hydrolase family 9 protein [Oscillospiraceae bacterium]